MKNLLDVDNLIVGISTKGKLPSLPFVDIKNKILGKNYDLSISFVGDKKSKELNNKFRNKNYPTNILSFSNSEVSGELVLNMNKIIKEAPKFNLDIRSFLIFLLIHGCLHLKGMEHGSIMDKAEKKFFKSITGKLL